MRAFLLFEGCHSADQCMCPSVFFVLFSCRDRNFGVRVSDNRGNGTITSVSSQLFSIKTLPNVGSELLGIQKNQKDAEPRQKEKKAGGIKPVCRELLGIQKTLPNVGPELLGIQEDQRDASFKNREDGGWYRPKHTVVSS